MDLDEYALHLGRLLSNLQSLEFVLRAFLANKEQKNVGPPGTDIYDLSVGASVPETPLTNYDSLSVLIDKFNRNMKERGRGEVDATLVEIRDALAHGRISAPVSEASLRIIKFGKARGGRVLVEFNEVMSADWLLTQKGRVHAAILRVHSEIEA